MELIARMDEREARVEIERHGDRYTVRVDDAVYQVDAVQASETGRSFLIEGAQHEVGVKSLGNGKYQVSSARGLTQVEMCDPLAFLAESSHAAHDGAVLKVTAYMPGRVVDILVAEGDALERGQGVMVLEAMKMENEIQSERAGTISQIFVEPGQAVERGDPLFEVT